MPISVNYMTPMGGYVKNDASPELTAGLPPVRPAAEQEQEDTSPVRVVVIDTGVYGDKGGRLAG